MYKMMVHLFFIFLTALTFEAKANVILSNNSKLNSSSPTHVLIAGYPEKLGNLFINSLLTKAKYYLEKSPSEQVVIVVRSEDKGMVTSAGFKVLSEKRGMLKPEAIKDSIKNIKSISSIDIFAHSNAMAGASLDSNSWVYSLLNEKDDLWDEVAKKVNDSSFIYIHGCNAGIKFAPLLATKLKIAVFAALTSTDFQYIYKDHFWAFDYDAKGIKKNVKNELNFKNAKTCGPYCTRMKPDNFSYRGHWGDWSAGGYPTYKLFCGSNNNVKCEKGALEGIYTFPSLFKYGEAKANLENFKKQLVDIMCPFTYNAEKQKVCSDTLEEALAKNETSTYSPFKGRTLVCDRVRCQAHFECSKMDAAFSPGSCSLERETDLESTTFVDEYKHFVSLYLKYKN